MELLGGAGGIAFLSLALNIVVMISQVLQAKSVAEMKVFMYQHFIPKNEANKNG